MAFTPTYCTGAQVVAATNDTSLAAESTAAIEAENGLIHRAEVQIDSYCGYWKRYNGRTQTRLFPRAGDVDSSGNSEIPEAVKFATIAQVEYMYINEPDMGHGVEEEASPSSREIIAPRAKQYLKGYIMKGGRITLAQGHDTEFL